MRSRHLHDVLAEVVLGAEAVGEVVQHDLEGHHDVEHQPDNPTAPELLISTPAHTKYSGWYIDLGSYDIDLGDVLHRIPSHPASRDVQHRRGLAVRDRVKHDLDKTRAVA